jgi:hypothetical protein
MLPNVLDVWIAVQIHHRSAAAFASVFHRKMLKAHALARLLSACEYPKGNSMNVTALVLMSALVLGVCTQAHAQRREVNSQVAQACKSELQQLCQGQKGKEAEQCLKNNESKLSSECKGAISKKAPQQ